MKRLFKALNLVFFLLFCIFPFHVSAQETGAVLEAGSQKGTITVQLDDLEQNSWTGVQFGLAKAGEKVNGRYQLVSPFIPSNVNLDQVLGSQSPQQMAAAAQTLAGFVQVPGWSAKTNDGGKAVFNDLDPGVYLLYPMDQADYEPLEPALVVLPAWNSSTQQDEYDVTIYPKHSPNPVLEIHKVDAATNKEILNKDFTFTMYANSQATQKIADAKGDRTTGTASFSVLDGTFSIKETKAPNGYQQSDALLTVTNTDGTLSAKLNGTTVTLAKKSGTLSNIYTLDFQNDPQSAPSNPSNNSQNNSQKPSQSTSFQKPAQQNKPSAPTGTVTHQNLFLTMGSMAAITLAGLAWLKSKAKNNLN